MAYASGYSYDIFISYSRIDDAEDMPGGLNWVSTFEKYLTIALRKRLPRADDLKVFFDRRAMQSNDELKELEDAARNSALFLAVCSRNYAEREWTLRELSAFEESSDDSRRLFAIEVMPLDQGQCYPASLQNRHRESFFMRTSEIRDTLMPLPPTHSDFGRRVHDLAEQMRNQLLAIRVVGDVQAATREIVAEPTQEAQDGACVYLGQATDDLESEREQLRRHLEQFGHKVRPDSYLRQDAEGFVEDVTVALDGAEMFIQLLGPLKGRTPPNLPKGYARTQIELANAAGVPIMQWRSSALQVEDVQDTEHREMLTGEHVIASGLQSFKSDVIARLEELRVPTEKSAGDQSLPMVFINADNSDLEYARSVRDEFARQGFYAAIPLEEGEQGELQSYLRENLLDCDGLVMIYGNASAVWTNRNLRHFNKLRASRKAPPKLVAVLIGPPEEKGRDLGLSMPGLRIVGSRREWQDDTIRDLIRELSV